jgi:hypothetical protein
VEADNSIDCEFWSNFGCRDILYRVCGVVLAKHTTTHLLVELHHSGEMKLCACDYCALNISF